jgi:trimeric autotransporter adhesin
MATSYTTILKLALPATGELSGTWGDVVNQNITSMVEQAIAGLATISTWAGASHTLTTADGTTSESRCAILQLTGSPGGAATVICPAATKIYIVRNDVVGGFAATIKTAAGTGVTIPNGQVTAVFCNGTNVLQATGFFPTVDIDGGTIDGTTIGGASAAAGTFTTATATTGNITTVNATTVDTTNIEVTNLKAKDGTSAGSIADSTGIVTLASSVLTTTDINGGTIDGTTVGASTPSTVASTNLSYTGTLTGSTGVINIGSGQVYKDASGNLGIGTSAPGVLGKLNVTSGFAATDTNERPIAFLSSSDSAVPGSSPSGLYLAYTGNASAALRKVEIAAATFGSGTTGVLSFQIGKMVIDSTGNVGIGTSSPLGKLKVAVGDNAPAASGDMNTGVIVETGYGARAINFGVNNTAGYSWINAAFSNNSGVADNLVLMTGATERLRIDSSGSVGIGTSTPGAKLTVKLGNIGIDQDEAPQQFFGAGGNVAGTNTTGGVLTVFGHAPNGVGDTSTPPYDGTNFVGAAGLMARGFSESAQYRGSLEFFTKTASDANATSRMIITHDGNVGIGTSSPTMKLDISGTSYGGVYIKSTSTNYSGIALENTNSATKWQIGVEGGTYHTAGKLNIGIDAVGSAIIIDSSRNVGIGTSSPAAKLDVVGGMNLSGQLTAGASGSVFSPLVSAGYISGTSNMYLRNISGTNRIDSYNDPITATIPLLLNASQHTFYIADAEKVRIDSSGNLLVGTTSEIVAHTFVSGNVNGTCSSRNTNTTAGQYFRFGHDQNNNFIVLNQAAAGVYLTNGGTTWTSLSDERTKDIIEPIANAAEKVVSLRAVIGKYKTDEDGVRRSFLIAQDVQAVLPEAVNTDKDGTLGLNYTDVIPLLVAAIQELSAKVDTLQTELNTLKGN